MADRMHYLNEELFKMGRWTLLPADSMSWHGQDSSDYFKKEFGFGKGILFVHTMNDGMQHAYCPTWFFKRIKNYIDDLKQDNRNGYEKKVRKFYALKQEAKEKLPTIVADDYTALSTEELITLYRKNRDWVHLITIYDQFGWLGENVFDQEMEKILTEIYDITKGSQEYHRVLFTLTKPQEISTTLEEKREVLKEAIAVLKDETDLAIAGKRLAELFGFMPVFAFGEPWNDAHYQKELTEVSRRPLTELEKVYDELANYEAIRNHDIENIVRKYRITPKDLQVFIDFGLMLDTRNEAEYILSLAGYYLLPIYKEMARRLYVSVNQLRTLVEDEIVSCLRGENDIQKLLDGKRRYVAWGFDETMDNIIFYNEEEAEKIFSHVEQTAKGFGGPGENIGICASPGKVVGTVRIIEYPKENHKVKAGDILITSATTVDYLPAMKKAAAFVTESGGLTCHAAVVAREFGVPCIVSLRDAMNKFKDGDKVEVNADAGTVTKIES